jgi:hypothetical protein
MDKTPLFRRSGDACTPQALSCTPNLRTAAAAAVNRGLVSLGILLVTPLCAAEASPNPPAPGLNRAWVTARVFAARTGFGWEGDGSYWTGGLIADLGSEINTPRGLKLGFELAPLTFTGQRPFLSTRFVAGYSNPSVSIGLAVGSGLTWFYPRLGPVLRIGRFERTHAHIRASWSVYPAQPLPTDLDIDVSTAVRGRCRGRLNLGGTYSSNSAISVYALLGVQYALGSGGEGKTTLLGLGAGFTWTEFALGPMLALSLDRRF